MELGIATMPTHGTDATTQACEHDVLQVNINLNRLVQQILDATRVWWRDEPQERGVAIQVQTDLAVDLPSVRASYSEVREALLHLVLSALESMPAGGTLMLRTLRINPQTHASAADASRRLLTGEGFCTVRLEVCDDGAGMSAPVQQRSHELFLAIRSDDNSSAGSIHIDSESGRGTTVRMEFLGLSCEHSALAGMPTLLWPLSLRILIVDDDPQVSAAMHEFLQSDGHRVIRAAGGQAAIDAFAAAHSSDEEFDAVITALGMPGVDGRRVAAAIKAVSPLTPVIMLTDRTHQALARDIPRHVDRILHKPPAPADLRRVLQELAHPGEPDS